MSASMVPIDQPPEVKRYYQDRAVAQQYMERRTAQPLNGVLHRRQVKFLNQALSERAPARVLEVACGPGRLTAAVRHIPFGVAVDASAAMLETAVQRMNGDVAPWHLLRSDAFLLPFRSGVFDAVYTLRFIRHFQAQDRTRLYTEIRRVLRPGGIFIVDALNRAASLPHRLNRGLDHYQIFDVLYEAGEFEAELQAAGFRAVRVEGIIKHLPVQRMMNRLRRIKLRRLASVVIAALEQLPSSKPETWMLLCERSL